PTSPSLDAPHLPDFSLPRTLPPRSPLFPYTTLFRSHRGDGLPRARLHPRREGQEALHRPPDQFDPGLPGQEHQVTLRDARRQRLDRKSTRLNSSHVKISYAVFCLKKKKSRILTGGRF